MYRVRARSERFFEDDAFSSVGSFSSFLLFRLCRRVPYSYLVVGGGGGVSIQAMTFERERQIPPRDNVEKKREEESVNDDGRAARACSDKKESDKERRKGKKSGRRQSRTRGVLAFESRHVSLQSYLFSLNGLSSSRRSKIGRARESSRLSLSLFSPKTKKAQSRRRLSRLSSDTTTERRL